MLNLTHIDFDSVTVYVVLHVFIVVFRFHLGNVVLVER